MNPHLSALTLGVKDVDRARQFYTDGLGWPTHQDFGQWVSYRLNNGALQLGLFARDALAQDAGVPANGSGFSGVTLSYLVRSEERVGEILQEAERAGGKIVKPAERAQWGGTSGIFSDPDGYLWKVAAGQSSEAVAE